MDINTPDETLRLLSEEDKEILVEAFCLLLNWEKEHNKGEQDNEEF